jgi:hypothetical protein
LKLSSYQPVQKEMELINILKLANIDVVKTDSLNFSQLKHCIKLTNLLPAPLEAFYPFLH